jgi:hypothetical protein
MTSPASGFAPANATNSALSDSFICGFARFKN